MLLKVHPLIGLYPANKGSSHIWQIRRNSSNFRHVELRGPMKRVRIPNGVAKEVGIEGTQDIGECGGIMPIPLATYAPRQATVFHKEIHEAGRCGACGGRQ